MDILTQKGLNIVFLLIIKFVTLSTVLIFFKGLPGPISTLLGIRCEKFSHFCVNL